MKIASEIRSEFIAKNAVLATLHVDVAGIGDELESIIAAKLEPVREALVYAFNAGLMAKEALARFEE